MIAKQLHHTVLMVIFIALATEAVPIAETANVEITSTVNAAKISLRDKLVLTVTMNAPHFLEGDSLTPAPTEDFEVIWASRMLRRHSTMRITVINTFIYIPIKTGAVGDFTVTASAYPLVVTADEELFLKVTVEGRGNVDMIPSIVEPDLSAFKLYNREEKEDISPINYSIGGMKSWLYSMVPLRGGSITIEPFSLSFFNPKDRNYHSIKTKPITVKILGDTNKKNAADDHSRELGGAEKEA